MNQDTIINIICSTIVASIAVFMVATIIRDRRARRRAMRAPRNCNIQTVRLMPRPGSITMGAAVMGRQWADVAETAALAAELEKAIGERDRARDLAVKLEGELAEVSSGRVRVTDERSGDDVEAWLVQGRPGADHDG